MSRQIHHDANGVIRSQDPGDLRRIKSHEDSRPAHVNHSPGKFHSLRRGRAHAAAQPQAETACASPFNGILFSLGVLLKPTPVGMCYHPAHSLRPCGPPIVLCTRRARTELRHSEASRLLKRPSGGAESASRRHTPHAWSTIYAARGAGLRPAHGPFQQPARAAETTWVSGNSREPRCKSCIWHAKSAARDLRIPA